ncbi:MAG: TIGR01777 family oxidoreductase [Gammaproteobacteria bacterium]
MRYLLTGGTGFIGKALCGRLAAGGAGLAVLTRDPRAPRGRLPAGTRLIRSLAELDPAEAFDAVINLAGEPIADARWTPARKRLLEQSRIALTEDLLAWIAGASTRPRLLLSASAVGFYGDQGERVLDEQSAPQVEYQHTLCRRWEEAALGAEALGLRTVRLRIGLVVGAGGGFLARMLPPFRLGLGGPIGNGRQWMSWIHRDDVIGLIEWLLARDDASGVYNATAPEPVDSRGFARTLGTVLHRPALLPLPAPVLRLALGEMSCLLLGGQRVLPARALAEGYRFRYPSLESALREATTPIA